MNSSNNKRVTFFGVVYKKSVTEKEKHVPLERKQNPIIEIKFL